MEIGKINMKTKDMPKVSRQELGDKLDEILEKIVKDNTAYLITDDGKKDLVICPADWYYPYNDKDFGLIVNSAIRYAMGRKTYMPSVVCDFTSRYLPILDDRTIQVIIEDISREIEYNDGDLPQKGLWLELKEKAEAEKMRRQAKK